jgi:hypothetical protein
MSFIDNIVSSLFSLAVKGLYATAEILSMSYEEVNVLIFCVAYPLILGISILLNIHLWKKLINFS